MTREEFAKGWLLLIAQPWGRRYEGNDEVAKTQREFYFDRFKDTPGGQWVDACRVMAEKRKDWPSQDDVVWAIGSKRLLRQMHPGKEKAWSIMYPVLRDEWASVVCTDQMLEALTVALPLADNAIQARMAFVERYDELVRECGANAVWKLRQGYDPQGRGHAVVTAMKAGYLTSDEAESMLNKLPLREDERRLADDLIGKIMGPDIKRIA